MDRNEKRFTLTAVVVVAGLLLTACGQGDEDTSTQTTAGQEVGDRDAEFITIATGGSSGVYFQIGATLADVLAEDMGSDTSVQATGASAQNINLLSDDATELAFVMGDAASQAREGSAPFEGDPRESLVAIMTMYPNTVQLIATEESGIESIDDLRGRNVAVGDMGSGAELNARTVLEAHGMTYEDFNADYLGYGEAAEQMSNGHVEATFSTSGVPNPSLVELGTNTDFVVVPIDGDGRENLLNEHDYFQEAVIPGGTYQDEQDVETVSVANHLLVNANLSEDTVYDITSVIFDNLDRVHNSHSEATNISLETATDDLVVPLHPGAERYYEENGVAVNEDHKTSPDDAENEQ